MRRLLSILLLAAFGLPVVAPLLALGQDPEANLPMCCRRQGAHHCMMNMQTIPTDAHRAGELCPHLKQPAATAPHLTTAGPASSKSLVIIPRFAALVIRRAEANRRVSRERSRHKRGPPAAILAA